MTVIYNMSNDRADKQSIGRRRLTETCIVHIARQRAPRTAAGDARTR